MRFHEESSLAWALVEEAAPHLSNVERRSIHVAIGAGETFKVIRHLIASSAGERVILSPNLLHRCTTWLDGYAGHEDARRLRDLVESSLAP